MLKLNNFSNYILKDISFELEDKNLIILGSNGSGKTTLAKILSGLIQNNSTINFYGENRTKFINYIPVGLDIFDEFINVLEFLELNKLHSDYTINNILNILNINHLKYKSSKYLSSGEAQLTLIASAILHNAKYTIFDEPTSNLDPIKLKLVYEILKDKQYLQNKIIITHNLNLAYKLGYDILFLEEGKVKFNGSNNDFFDTTNLNTFFKNSVQKIDNNIVINL